MRLPETRFAVQLEDDDLSARLQYLLSHKTFNLDELHRLGWTDAELAQALWQARREGDGRFIWLELEG